MQRVFIALGSNINSEYNMRAAIRRLSGRCHLLDVSPVYQTLPVGKTDQPNFLNAVALIETDLTATELKTKLLHDIEQELGRIRSADKHAARTIDLDITLFGDQVLDLGHRHIPDPDLLKYAHIALPLADIAPQQRHPETGQTLLEIAQQLPVSGIKCRSDIILWPE
ncbi:MAG: 2-amino-4-hydroxy-6-hydroxymethyldihydropteridine diphosphokinase [Anaerolineales bacterium]|nr:2-amino-4-hydroxy-6-hydroxymethyldihydropteridine diphosphokinase [Anaerolineales bacterium]